MARCVTTIGLVILLIIAEQEISLTLTGHSNDPFEYVRKLTRDIQVHSQCDRIPPFQTQLDSSFFDSDLKSWQRTSYPPASHRTLEAFVQLDTLRQSSYFSEILQGNSQARVPGKSMFNIDDRALVTIDIDFFVTILTIALPLFMFT
jgi:hypothetical protein